MAAQTASEVPAVLLVDDDPRIGRSMCALLRHQPYRVLTASNADACLAIMRQEPIDVVVCDVQMPGMSGPELLARIAEEYPDTVRMVMTGHASVDAAISAINDGGVFRFLEKPCSSEEIKAEILDALCERAKHHATRKMIDAARAIIEPRPSGERLPERQPAPDVFDGVTPREREVLAMLVDGIRIAQIAKALFISEATVRNHVKSLFRKLRVHSQAELV